MLRKTLMAAAAALVMATAGLTGAANKAQARTHVYLGFGFGVPYWGYYPYPYYVPAPYYYVPRYYYPRHRYRRRCWRVKRWRRVWNGHRWVRRRVWVRRCRRVRYW